MRQRIWSLIQRLTSQHGQHPVCHPTRKEDMAVPIASEVEVPEARMSRAISEGFVSLDTVEMGPLFSLRAVVMKSPPKFLRGRDVE